MFVFVVTVALVVVVGDMAVNSLVVVVLGAITSLLGTSSSNMNRFLVFG
jgi:hypothetical protein